jgi:alkylhydroperoxidase/carboxymuconolactone decarboxylase family protein YurZ
MCQEKSESDITKDILKAIEKEYGFIPLVNQVLSDERPDLFIPAANLSKAVFYGKSDMSRKNRYLAALSAAAALGAEHCMTVQMQMAVKNGATKDEILETMQIASLMAMTHSQSHAFRKFKEMFP